MLFSLLPLLCCFLLSCAPAPERGTAPAVPVQPLAILEAGEYPLWFELAEEGPAQIASAEDASLSPFRPWPLARHIRFVLAVKEELVMAVNQDGFLRLAAGKDAPGVSGAEPAGLFRYAFTGFRRNYTTASLFVYEGKPAVLLYRDDFFVESGAALPSPRAEALEPDESAPLPLEIPALALWPSGEGWDAEALRPGRDGFWYFRLVKKDLPRPEIVYRRSRDLNSEGEAVSPDVFRNSALPEPSEEAPPALRSALNAAFALAGGASAEVVSPDFDRPRRFTGSVPGVNAGGGSGESAAGGGWISGYYRRNGSGSFALAALPDGRGFFARESADGQETGGPGAAAGGTDKAADTAGADKVAGGMELRSFTLPALPEKFVYTHLGLAGNTLFAAWEEQEDFNIGAAGFMVIAFSL